jgi:hypothetical protein
MRDQLKSPITEKEIIAALTEVMDYFDQHNPNIGDMKGMYLEMAINIVKEYFLLQKIHPELFPKRGGL